MKDPSGHSVGTTPSALAAPVPITKRSGCHEGSLMTGCVRGHEKVPVYGQV